MFSLRNNIEVPKTIMEQKIEGYRRNFLLRLKREEEESRESKRMALCDVERIKKHLVEDVGVKEIYLFGSILREDFRKDSDIDIAIGGLGKKRFFSIWSHLDEFTDFNIELVDLDERNDFFRQQIRERGRKIYERGQ